MCIIVYSLIIYCTSKLSDENYLVPDHKSINRKIDHNLLIWFIQLCLYVISYFRSTYETLFSYAMIHYMRHLMSHHLIYLSILSRWIILISYSQSCAFSSIILHKQFCECQTASWQQTHMWLSYWCIFLSYHVIGEWAHIHFLYLSEFRDLVPTLVDPINFITRTSTVMNSWRIF